MPKDSEGKETGWISKHAFQENALAADDMGRKAMADEYILMRMLNKAIRERLSLVGQLERRLKAVEKVLKEPASPSQEATVGTGKINEKTG